MGLQILIRFVELACNRNRRTYNRKILVSEVIVGLFIIQLVQFCRLVVKANLAAAGQTSDEARDSRRFLRYFPVADGADDELRAQLRSHIVLRDFAIAHRTRIEFLKPTLSTLVLLHLFPDTFKVYESGLVPAVDPPEVSRRASIASQSLMGY